MSEQVTDAYYSNIMVEELIKNVRITKVLEIRTKWIGW